MSLHTVFTRLRTSTVDNEYFEITFLDVICSHQTFLFRTVIHLYIYLYSNCKYILDYIGSQKVDWAIFDWFHKEYKIAFCVEIYQSNAVPFGIKLLLDFEWTRLSTAQVAAAAHSRQQGQNIFNNRWEYLIKYLWLSKDVKQSCYFLNINFTKISSSTVPFRRHYSHSSSDRKGTLDHVPIKDWSLHSRYRIGVTAPPQCMLAFLYLFHFKSMPWYQTLH